MTTIEEITKRFAIPEKITDCLTETGKRIEINWDEIKTVFKGHRGEDYVSDVVRVCIESGIASFTSKGNYFLIDEDEGIPLNPFMGMAGLVYFEHKNDADGFRKAVCSNAQYPVKILRGID